jgi:hypothetical protein
MAAAGRKAQSELITLIHNGFFVQPDKKAYKDLVIPRIYCHLPNIRHAP